MRCDVLAQGVVDAASQLNLSVPLKRLYANLKKEKIF